MKMGHQMGLILESIFAFILIVIIIFIPAITALDHTTDAWLQKGDGFYKNNSYDLALRCYDKAIEIDPLDAEAWNNRGNALRELGRDTESDAAFTKAIELGYADSIQIDIKPDEIVEEITTINESTPINNTQAEIRLDKSDIDNSIVLLFDASNSMRGNKMKNAKIAIEEFISGLDPSSNEVALIVFYDCDNIKTEQSLTTDKYRISSRIDPIQPTGETPLSAAIDFSKYYIDQNANGIKKKIILFTDGEETCPYKATYSGTEEIDVSIIGFDIRKNSPQEKKLIELAKKVDGNYLNAEDASNPEALASSLRQAYVGLNIKNNFDASMVWVNKGNAFYNQEKFEEAIEAYDEAIRLDPNNEYAWHSKGLALGELDRYNEAIEAYDETIRIDPENAPAWHNKGVALTDKKMYDKALQAYEKAIKLDPSNALTWNNKGVILNIKGNYNKAIEAFNKAIRLDPNDARPWSGKGDALNELGRYDESVDAYDEAIRLDPHLEET